MRAHVRPDDPFKLHVTSRAAVTLRRAPAWTERLGELAIMRDLGKY